MFTYILRSLKNKKYYVGSTISLEKRLKEHNSGIGGLFTKINGPWELVCFRTFASIEEARTEEKKVKSYKSGNGFKKIINGDVAEWPKAPHC